MLTSVGQSKQLEERGHLSVVSRTNDKPIGLGLVGQMSEGAVRTAVSERAPRDDSLLKRVCRSLESAGLSVVVVVAMEAGPGVQPSAHAAARSRRASSVSPGLSVVTDAATKEVSADLNRSEADLPLMSARVERYRSDHKVALESGPDQAPVVVLTTAHNEDAARAAVAAAGLGFMVWGNGPAQDASIRALPALEDGAPEREPDGQGVELVTGPAPGSVLTAREIQVLRAFANGSSTIEVAREYFVSPKTVKNHLAHIYAKLGVASRTQAVAKAVRQGIVQIG